MPTMSPTDVQGTLRQVCFAPGVRWDAESLAQFFGCSVAEIGSIPGVLRFCAMSPAGARLYEFEEPFFSTVQVARRIGKSRTAVARLKRLGRLNPRSGPNNAALFLVREVNKCSGWSIRDDEPTGAVTKSESLARHGKQPSQESTSGQNGNPSAISHPTTPTSKTERLRALLIEDVRLFEQLEVLPLERAARDQWGRFIAVRRAAIGIETD